MAEVEDPYARFDHGEATLRDELALDRTLLANERTLLAYLRSSMALALAGFTFIELFADRWLSGVGIATLPIALTVGTVGLLRWRRMNRAINGVRERLVGPKDRA